jgi:NTP pyrophosphatase (non-canonical NTP hydrolase)
MDFKKLCNQAYKNATKKGFYDKDPSFGALLMQVVEELGEASDADRKGKQAKKGDAEYLTRLEDQQVFKNVFENSLKDTVEDELADAFIILAGICKHRNIDIESSIICKMRYNKTRKRLHGKKY